MSAFGPAPVPGAVQASFVAASAQGPRPREKSRPQDADPPRPVARDEVRLSDPLRADAVDAKPDAVEDRRQGRGRNQVARRAPPAPDPADSAPRLDVRA